MSHKYKQNDEVYFNFADGVMKGTIMDLHTKDEKTLATIETRNFTAHLFVNEISFNPNGVPKEARSYQRPSDGEEENFFTISR